MSNTASLKKEYQDRIVPALTKEFGYKTVMQVPVLKKIVINQGLGMAAADKKIDYRYCHQRIVCNYRSEGCCDGFKEGYLKLQVA